MISSIQIVECFPNSMPKDLPDVLAKIKWSKPCKEIANWDDWWIIHERILKSLRKQVSKRANQTLLLLLLLL